ncbi:phosphohistidine phosphatase SixA [Pseudomonas sp. HR96]|uniref:phosphohistidine phosphatase SixA n=1 Tax=Pseudomonas sp. HR96 TaxID=1027966 RepID=UPI002A75EEA0|nr:phosphohistidine phosphatase SixA [Pseudomonas sp. HR96]WPO98587.1 phosphohistidine phosphatase SixA [Pseudomonas sp. HR96]
MNLWVLRHGQAQNRAASDAQRELTERGREEVRESAAHLIGQPLEAILVSPYLRTQQSAALVREVLGFAPELVTMPWLTPDSEPAEVIEQLEELPWEHVLLVSHQPLAGALIGLLQHGHYRQPQPMDTASLAHLTGDSPQAGSMTLVSARHV